MDPDSSLIRLIAVLALVGISGIVAIADRSLAAVRRPRIEALGRNGNRQAQHVLDMLEQPDRYAVAAQTIIAAAMVSTGWLLHSMLGAGLETRMIDGSLVFDGNVPAARIVSVTVSAVAAVFLYSVFAVRIPQLLAVHEPERVALRTNGPLRLAALLVRPATGLGRWTANVIARVSGMTPKPVAAPASEEIRLLVEGSGDDTVGVEQEQMLLGVIQLRDTLVREVMTPRRDIIALPSTATRAEALALIAEEGHSRIPVYSTSIDEIIGVLLAKDLLTHLAQHGDAADETFDLTAIVREPYFVPDTKRAGELLPELRMKSIHMAIVLDEFGGTDGLVTLEDMLEEIVGDIYDEHDVPEDETEFTMTDSGIVLIDGGASIFDVNERFDLGLPEQDYDTIGGFVFGELGRVPVAGDSIRLDRAELQVAEVDERRVTLIRLVPPSNS